MKAKASEPAKPAAKRTARAQTVAKGILAGKTQAKIAQETGVSPKTIQRDLEHGPVQAVIIGLVTQHRERISRQFERSLAVIDAAFSAEVLQLVKRKVPVLDEAGEVKTVCTGKTSKILEEEIVEIHRIGPDQYARLAAVKRHLEIVTAGRQSIKPEEKNPDRTLLTIEALDKLARQGNP